MSDYKLDHAPHVIEAHQRLKAMRNAFLKGQYDDALTQCNTALVELRLASIAIKYLADKQHHKE